MAEPDLTEFVKLSKPRRRVCQVAAALAALPPNGRVELEAALATDIGVITTGAIREWLARRELEASVSAITYHRRGNCACSRDD